MASDSEHAANHAPAYSGGSSDEDARHFAALTATPLLSIPGFGMVVLGGAIFAWATMAAIAGTIPVALAVFLNGFALYLFFSLMHDAIHENAASNKLANEWLGSVSLFFMLPFAPLEIARWIHLKHHACAWCFK